MCGPQRAALVVFAMLPTWCGMLCVSVHHFTLFDRLFCTNYKTNKQKKNIKNLIQRRNCGHLMPASPPAGRSVEVLFLGVAMETSLCEDEEIIVSILFADSDKFYLVRFTFQPVLISRQQFYVKTGRTKLLDLFSLQDFPTWSDKSQKKKPVNRSGDPQQRRHNNGDTCSCST